jgi:cardiolipin synthase
VDSKENLQHNWKFYLTPNEVWKAMYQDCAVAKKSIYFEQYIFENDEIGRKFLELFIEKLSEKIAVNLVCDGFGSSSLRNCDLIKEFIKKGGEFRFYNPLNLFNIFTPWRWFPRTHAKTLLIDSNIAYVGGIGIAKRMEFWRDIDIRIKGPITNDILFSLSQKKLTKNSPNFCYVQSRSFTLFHVIYRELSEAISAAKNYIYITTAFFVPSNHFIKLLMEARRRGVEVIIIIPEYSEVKIADYMALTYIKNLLNSGIKIFFYDQAILHSKIVIIDDVWATVGSTNMDILSFFYNQEANVIISDYNAINELKKYFFEDVTQSKKFTLEILNNISLRKKFLGQAARILKIFFTKGVR